MTMNFSQQYLNDFDYNYNTSVGRDDANISDNANNFGSNRTNYSYTNIVSARPKIPIWLIPCYSIILLAAIVGNLLVISTLVQNRRMRTITNVFLLNLAISDILLGVFCMPVTLVGTLLRHFIFGEFLCKLIQFSQATSVAVSSWTLVAISCERYYAICHPLRSRTWQTISHAYKIIGFIWIGSIICMTPIAVFSQLIPTSRQGLSKCREAWPKNSIAYERSYNILLDILLLILPLMILCVAYILITRTLYININTERALIFGGNTKISSNDEMIDDLMVNAPTSMRSLRGFTSRFPLRYFSISRGISVTNSHDTFQHDQQGQQTNHPPGKQRKQQPPNYGDDDTLALPVKRKILTDGHKQYYYVRSGSTKSLNGNFKNGIDESSSNISNDYNENDNKNNCTRTKDNGHVRNSKEHRDFMAGNSTTHSMTVINVPQKQRFQLHQQRKSDRNRQRANFMSALKATDSALRRFESSIA